MKLICEHTEDVSGVIVESTSGKKNYYIEGIFMQSNVKNRNGRIYPRTVMEQEVNRYIKESVNTNRAVGELGHPEGPATDLKRVSHRITELKQNNDDFYGKALVLEGTVNGKTLIGLIEGGVNFGVSSRGLGAVKANSQGINEVSQFRIITAADVVADPSAPNAFVQGVMEDAEWIYDAVNDSYKLAQIVEEIKDTFDNTRPSRVDEETKLSLFKRYMGQLSQFSK